MAIALVLVIGLILLTTLELNTQFGFLALPVTPSA